MDLTLGVVTMLVAGAYIALAAQIPESLLSDEVGASGLPTALGWAMGMIGALLAARSLRRSPSAPAEAAPDEAGDTEEFAAGMRPHWMALGLLAMLSVFVIVAPYLGYIVTTALLLAGAAWFSGALRDRMLLPIALVGAAALWLLFDVLLAIPLPVGSLWGGS
ncbi:MAG: Tripartite tricarboxylate transporter TctB family protein [Massilia sp.]|nr:Tripartite tricarboxylate transporter TctB family protein [Massilia sp.]